MSSLTKISIVVLIIGAGLFSCSEVNEYADIERAIKNEEFDKALLLIEAMKEEGCDSDKIHLAQSKVFFETELYDEVLESLTIVLERNPQHEEALFKKALTLQYKGKHQQAIDYYEKLLTIDDSQSIYHLNHAISLQETGHVDAALESYYRCVSDSAFFLDVYKGISCIYLEFKPNQDSAMYILNEILAVNEKSDYAYAGLAKVYNMMGDYHAAIKNATKAAKLNEKNANAYYESGLAKNKIYPGSGCADMEKATVLGHRKALSKYSEMCKN